MIPPPQFSPRLVFQSLNWVIFLIGTVCTATEGFSRRGGSTGIVAHNSQVKDKFLILDTYIFNLSPGSHLCLFLKFHSVWYFSFSYLKLYTTLPISKLAVFMDMVGNNFLSQFQINFETSKSKLQQTVFLKNSDETYFVNWSLSMIFFVERRGAANPSYVLQGRFYSSKH